MNNELYNINGIYSIIRKYYISQFPHKINFLALDSINHHLSEHNNAAKIVKKDGAYILSNPNPYQKSQDPFANSLSIGTQNLESYLSDSEGLKHLFQDINALYTWLVEYDFIKDGIATEKLLTIKAILS
ncbi:hypothetical protein [Citrobacter freundii]|uniref:hypothetical protein n=1 Tax=Citrobacter freundii TaxID=546 RepID=UPI001BCF5BA1|nr:hypothetical protein [Citrobacter freundii]